LSIRSPIRLTWRDDGAKRSFFHRPGDSGCAAPLEAAWINAYGLLPVCKHVSFLAVELIAHDYSAPELGAMARAMMGFRASVPDRSIVLVSASFIQGFPDTDLTCLLSTIDASQSWRKLLLSKSLFMISAITAMVGQ
jgi:hypothetical protein